MYKWALSQQMFDDSKNEDGKLHRLLMRVLKDGTLALEFRDDGEKDEENQGISSKGANVEQLPFYKQSMDFWFTTHLKYERECQ